MFGPPIKTSIFKLLSLASKEAIVNVTLCLLLSLIIRLAFKRRFSFYFACIIIAIIGTPIIVVYEVILFFLIGYFIGKKKYTKSIISAKFRPIILFLRQRQIVGLLIFSIIFIFFINHLLYNAFLYVSLFNYLISSAAIILLSAIAGVADAEIKSIDSMEVETNGRKYARRFLTGILVVLLGNMGVILHIKIKEILLLPIMGIIGLSIAILIFKIDRRRPEH
jgi:drug/metabolite transporter (DMT)-like permease